VAQKESKSKGFRLDAFADLAQLEADNFWFQQRNKLILHLIANYVRPKARFLEIGCGTGFVLNAIASQYPTMQMIGSELFEEGVAIARVRCKTALINQLDARKLPFEAEIDAVGAFDVIEHIYEDEQVLSEVYKVLVPGGVLLATVPQHPWLWSQTDVYACHERRYRMTEFQDKLLRAGFTIEFSSSFVFFLLPFMYVSRLLNNRFIKYDPTVELRLNPLLNTMLGFVLSVERLAIHCGIRFPVGGSRVVVARKPKA